MTGQVISRSRGCCTRSLSLRPLALLACLLPAVPGCLWIPGTAVAIWATSDHGDGSSAAEPPLPPPEEAGETGGPFLLLEGDPAAVALGDFIGGEAGPHLGAAVIFTRGQSVAFYEGDGTGRLFRHSIVPVSARNTMALATVPPRPGGTAGLLVATAETLELIRWDTVSEGFRTSFVPLEAPDATLRDLEVLDLDGDSTLDAAVSSFENRWIEFFRTPEDSGPLIPAGKIHLRRNPPRSIAAAVFPPDVIYQSYRGYLAVLTQDAGGDALFLYLQKADWTWESSANAELRLNEPAFALAKGGSHALDRFPDDPTRDNVTPDILFTRADGTGIVMVRPPGEPGCNVSSDWQLERFRGGGHLSPSPTGVALLHFPDGDPGVWGRVTADSSLNAVICSYADKSNGLEVARAISYPLPGQGRGLAAGDLNGDRHQDLVALSASPAPPLLAILLANPPEEAALKGPFRFPFSNRSGETHQPAIPAISSIAFGRVASGEPFLAVGDRNNAEATILFFKEEDDGQITVLREERYATLDSRPDSILAGQFDGENGDDVVVVARKKVFLLNNTMPVSGGPHFEPTTIDILEHLLRADPLIVGEEFGTPRMRWAVPGLLDDNEFLDVAICLSNVRDRVEGDDFIAVILNPGRSDLLQVRFYPTPDGPRRLALANLNGDEALDLVVSCDRANRVRILFGASDPSESFVRESTGGNLQPLTLDGLPGCDEEVEDIAVVHASPDTPPAAWPLAEWIVTSHTDSVQLYRIKNPGSSILEFEAPCPVYTGSDPEALLVFDLFEDPGQFPDLAICEETGSVVFMKHKGLVDGGPGCDHWSIHGLPISSGAPQQIVPFHWGEVLHLAVGNRSTQLIQVFQRGQEDHFATPQELSITKANLQGERLGMATAAATDGRFSAALIVEDSDADGGPAVDLITFASPTPDKPDLIDFGLTGENWYSTSPLESLDEWPLALLSGQFVGAEGYPDLLVCEESGSVASYPKLDPGDFDNRKAPERPLPNQAAVMDWKAVQGSAGSPLVAIAGNKEVQVFSIGSTQAVWRSTPGTYSSIRQISPGWLQPGKDPGQDLFLAVLEANRLQVEFVRLDGSRSLPREILSGALSLGAVGSRDLNGDGMDDLAVVDDTELILEVFLSNGGKDPFSIRKSVAFSHFAPAVALDFLDANGDSKVDICFGAKGGEVFVFLGNGAGSFQEPVVLYASPDIEALATRDLDGDGRDEILVAAPLPGFIILQTRRGDQ